MYNLRACVLRFSCITGDASLVHFCLVIQAIKTRTIMTVCGLVHMVRKATYGGSE